MAIDVLASQLSELKERYPDSRVEQAPDGQRVLVVPATRLPPGWSLPSTTVRVVLPVGFPHARPDCFYVDGDLRLASGAEPVNSSQQAVFGGTFRWFSWHVVEWDPANGSLDRYVRFCERRLREIK